MSGPRDAEELARSVLRAVRGQVAREEAVGVLRSWQRCDVGEARRSLADGDGGAGRAGQDGEAARVVAIIEGDARGRADPDWD
ncbi:hypothetical protein SAMN05192558_1179 [Actinokineospora alba]|uniref:ANTAR domain-containing protein n=1 Tax=Actinokineospora alba TaxID=504798 RepID=A0A1H0W1G7_9PSEU|nr:hypothetical protein [Actinokineospora alba]TDP67766.1 hypothetical protein C8E96_3317 [Actinokineospora alba]SDI71475.1 hypothetical protein SAMN05421871_1079 [Actinokineospora alba]SDP84542.1 hypothetical protein SAMN05192558_1179 [Actinokineospora alba]